LLLVAVVCLAVGAATGAFIMRQRYNAREVVIAVNGALITKDDLFRRMELNAGVTALKQLVEEELQLQFARKKGAAPTDTEVNAKYAEAMKNPKFVQTLAASRVRPEDYKRNLRLTLAKAAVINKGVQVTEAEIRKFYKDNIDRKNPTARFYTPESAQIAVIVTASKASADRALRELENGSSWQDVVEKYSQDRSKSNNGVLPPFLRGRTRAAKVPGLESAIFSMKVNQQVGPLQFTQPSGTGRSIKAWWIIRCLDRKPAETQPFEKVKEEARMGAMLTKGLPIKSTQIEKEFAEFRKKAHVQEFWPQYRGVIDLK